MVAAGCVIEGEVINSVLSPGVRVAKGAVVRDSIIGDDCLIGAGAKVDLAILDKRVRLGEKAVAGHGDDKGLVNREFPKHLYTGISLIGKGAEVPPSTVIGRNCIVHPLIKAESFSNGKLESGETI